MKKLLLIIGLVFSTMLTYSQKEALTWFFGDKIRLNFHGGGQTPQQFFPSQMNARKGSFCMSNKVTGTPIFYSNGEIVYNDAGGTLTANLYGDAQSLQPGIAFPAPGSDNCYYIFTTGNSQHPGAFYSVVDMSLNSGIGGIPNDSLNIKLPGIDSCQKVVMATKHSNNRWYWVVYRTMGERNKLYAYLVTENGVSTQPVISDCMTHHRKNDYAMSKFAPAMRTLDGILYCYTSDNWTTEEKKILEIYYFNIVTGNFINSGLFWLMADREYDLQHRSNGIEFSTDGKFLYSSLMALEPGPPQAPKQFIVQYDVTKLDDPNGLTKRIVATKDNLVDIFAEMQLARDGRIYIAQDENKNNKALSRIFFPNKSGADCDFRDGEIPINGSSESTFGLPTFVPSFFSRFDYKGTCDSDSTYFTSTFHPVPITVTWDFGDGSPTVTGLHPVHKFPGVGQYRVKVSAQYPREEIEEFERVVYISNTPRFELGDTKYVCPGGTVTLDAGLVSGYLQWSTGEDSTAQITVPAGTYTLTATNLIYGCTRSDTVSVIEYLAPSVDATNVDIFPATCTGPTGYIKGIEVNGIEPGQEPFTYVWKDAGGNVVSTSNTSTDFDNAPPGFFTLYATDSHGCLWNTITKEVKSIGDTLLATVDSTGTFCGNDNGTIQFSPRDIMTGLLDYQIEPVGGTPEPWQSGNLFVNLPSGKYYVRARVHLNQSCKKEWGIVSIGNYIKPTIEIDEIVTEYDLDSLNCGTAQIKPIDVPGFWYAIYDSLNPANLIIQDNPFFENLTHGIVYKCYMFDANNCVSDTGRFVIPWVISTHLISKVKGGPPVCKGVHTFADLKVFNFENIVEFKAILDYDKSKITCLTDYLNLDPRLGSVNLNVDVAAGRATITWSSPTPLTLTNADTVRLLTLEFSTKAAGVAKLTWVFPPTDFIEGAGFHLKVTGLIPSEVVIHENPTLAVQPKETCVGKPITFTSNINPPGTYSFLWTRPDGFTETGSELTINNPDTTNNGFYNLVVTNTEGCRDTSGSILTVHPLPEHGFTNDDSLYFDFPATLEALPGFASYLWMNGATTQGILVQDSGYYTVTVTDAHTCSNTFTVFANSKYEKPFFYRVPTAFSPNGDGINDVFRPHTDHELIKQFKLLIFDRWGQMVYQTEDSGAGWDGKINGLNALPGPYGWSIIYSNYHVYNVKAKGIIWLIR